MFHKIKSTKSDEIQLRFPHISKYIDSNGNQKGSSLSRTTDHSQSNFSLTGVNGEAFKWNPSGFFLSNLMNRLGLSPGSQPVAM